MEDTKKISTPTAIIIAGFMVMLGIIISRTPILEKPNTKKDISSKSIPASYSVERATEKDHIFGDINTAEVVIIEYSDTECPFCKDFHKIMKNIMQKYDGKVAWVYRHFPLDVIHTKARIEAEATECVAKLGGNEKFWQYLDMIFENTNSNDSFDLNLLPIFAEKVGIDKGEFDKCLSNKETASDVQEDFENGTNAGATGTPFSIIIKDDTEIPVNGANEQKILEVLDTLLK